MKKVILLFSLIFVISITMGAQGENGFGKKPGRSATFVKNSFFDNWFIGAGAGGNIYFGDKDVDADIRNRISVTPVFQLGKWFSPYSGARIKLSGGTNIHTFNDDGFLMTRNKYASAELNLLWNMTDYLMHYNPHRVYSFIPYVGAGWAYGWDYTNLPEEYATGSDDHVNSVTFDAGIINHFKFSQRVALDIEFSGKLLRDNFDQRTGGKNGFDILGTASASLVFTIGKKATFTQAVMISQREIDDLNNAANMRRSVIEATPNNAPQQTKEPTPTVIINGVVNELNININNYK